MLEKLFSSLKYRNYRLFVAGQIVSLTGTWIHWTAQQWLVYQLTGSKAFLGIIAACQSLPMLFFSIPGGIIADRLPKKKIIITSQWILMISALVMGVLVLEGAVRIWHVALLASVSGLCMAFSMPARQSFVVEIVGHEDLMNAIGLNSSIFNSARIVGPAIAGVIMADFDMGWCFVINGISFISSIAALTLMKVEIGQKGAIESVVGGMKESLKYVYDKRELFWLLVFVSVFGIFGMSYSVLVPAFASDVLRVSEKAYGLLLTASGLGALLAALTVATAGAQNCKKLILAGLAVFLVSALAFALSRNYALSVFSQVFAGFGITSFIISSNTFVQLSVSDDLRGRVMGIWTFVFGGMMPLGSLQMGFIAQHFGLINAVVTGVLVCAGTTGFFLYYVFRERRTAA